MTYNKAVHLNITHPNNPKITFDGYEIDKGVVYFSPYFGNDLYPFLREDLEKNDWVIEYD